MKKLSFYLFPSETNDYKPFITSSTALVCFIVIIWGLRLAVPASISLAKSYIDPVDVMNRINNERSSRNIPTVTTNAKLIVAAQGKADDMLTRSYFSHIDPDGNYVWPRIEAAGYTPYTTLGENLAMDFTSASEMVTAWMNSPTHRANLLNSAFVDQGVAQSSGNYEPNHDTTIVVSLFGKLGKTARRPTSSTSAGVSSGSNQNPVLAIGPDPDVSITQVSGHTIVDLTDTVSGNPTLVTAKLLTQSITLLPQSGSDKYSGRFTFNLTDDLSHKEISIEARNAAGTKITSSVTLTDIQSFPAGAEDQPVHPTTSKIAVPQMDQAIKILRVIFGILSVVYLGFLAIDAVIIRRQKIQRPGVMPAPQIAIFLLLAFVNLFLKF
jgi:hypothetical protein